MVLTEILSAVRIPTTPINYLFIHAIRNTVIFLCMTVVNKAKKSVLRRKIKGDQAAEAIKESDFEEAFRTKKGSGLKN